MINKESCLRGHPGGRGGLYILNDTSKISRQFFELDLMFPDYTTRGTDMAKKKLEDMSAEELMEHAKAKGKEEIQELVDAVTPYFKKIKDRLEALELDDKFEDFIKDKKEDLAAFRALIEEKKAEMKADVDLTGSAPRQTWTINKKAQIVNEYDNAAAGTKTAVLKAHGVKGNPIASWKNNKDVKTAMQKIQEKKK